MCASCRVLKWKYGLLRLLCSPFPSSSYSFSLHMASWWIVAKRLTGCSPGQQPLRLLLASIALHWASFYELSPPVCSQSSLGLPHSFFLSTSHCHCLFASLSHQLSCEILGGRDWLSYVMASMDRCSIKFENEWMLNISTCMPHSQQPCLPCIILVPSEKWANLRLKEVKWR